MVTWDLHSRTDTTENITFPQLRWRAVEIHLNLIVCLFHFLQVEPEYSPQELLCVLLRVTLEERDDAPDSV